MREAHECLPRMERYSHDFPMDQNERGSSLEAFSPDFDKTRCVAGQYWYQDVTNRWATRAWSSIKEGNFPTLTRDYGIGTTGPGPLIYS
jgi:hypothetical protein